MPIEYEVHPDKNLMIVTRKGAISREDEDRSYRQRTLDPQVTKGIRVLIDCREIEVPDDSRMVQYLADRVSSKLNELKCGRMAILVSGNTMFGMARMYMSMTDQAQPDTDVFRDYNAALTWLSAEERSDGASGN